MEEGVQRSRLHFTSFWSDKHEVKIPSLQAAPHSNLHFHLPLLPSETYSIFPHPPLHYLSLCFIFIFHRFYLLKPPSNHCYNLTLPCQYFSGQLSVCARFHMKWDWNQLSKREQMVILSWWHLLAFTAFLHHLFHPLLFHDTRGLTTSSTTFPESIEPHDLLALYLSPQSTVLYEWSGFQ